MYYKDWLSWEEAGITLGFPEKQKKIWLIDIQKSNFILEIVSHSWGWEVPQYAMCKLESRKAGGVIPSESNKLRTRESDDVTQSEGRAWEWRGGEKTYEFKNQRPNAHGQQKMDVPAEDKKDAFCSICTLSTLYDAHTHQ